MKFRQEYSSEEMEQLLTEAYFHLGRVLYEEGENYDDAISILNKVIQRDKENIHALYYLGQAIRKQVERDYLKRAEDYLRQYLLHGAPLGHESEVRYFLYARRSYMTSPGDPGIGSTGGGYSTSPGDY